MSAARKVTTVFLDEDGRDNPKTATRAEIYRLPETDEYVVRFFEKGRHLVEADYFTNDKGDATGTAFHELNRMGDRRDRPYLKDLRLAAAHLQKAAALAGEGSTVHAAITRASLNIDEHLGL